MIENPNEVRHLEVQKLLLKEAIERDDTSAYIGNLLVRQRRVNEQVVAFTEELLSQGSTVIDACAGPEGSFLASTRRGYKWIGNDVSQRFARHLDNTGASITLSDFSSSPYKENIADAVFFIFALNNILQPEKAIKEASRVTKSDGIVVISDSGPTLGAQRIILSSVLKDTPFEVLLRGAKFECTHTYFNIKSYSMDEYTDYCLRYRFGVSRKELLEIIEQQTKIPSSNEKKARVVYALHQLLTRLFLQHTQELAKLNGLSLVKAGGSLAAQKPNGEWELSSPFRLDTNDWLSEFIKAREGEGNTYQSLPDDFKHSRRRIFFPILCFKKFEAQPAGSQHENTT